MELTAASYPMGSAFMSKRFHADIYTCPGCGRVELFDSEENTVVCPVCGTKHSALEKCMTCALNTAFENHTQQN